jgi:competence protein ComEA
MLAGDAHAHMNTLKPASIPPDAKKRDALASCWTLSRRELVLWAAIVWLIPFVALAARPHAAGSRPEIRLARPAAQPAGQPATLARLDLNRATEQELDLLPGIGPSRARKIVAYRALHGPFRSVADLAQVPGFPDALVERLEPLLTTSPPPLR